MVLAKSGTAGSWVIAVISAVWSAKACSNAGRKCSGAISANGGVSNGVCHACSSGFGAGEGTNVSKVSDMTIPVTPQMNGAIYITPLGFFGPFTLDSGGLFREIAPPNRIQKHELAALPDQRPPDHLADRRHRHQCRY